MTEQGEGDVRSRLILDQVLPRYDVAVVHAAVFRAPPDLCFRTLRQLNVFRHPVVRALFAARAVPEWVGSRLVGRSPSTRVSSPRRFAIDDMVRPPFNWLLLAEEPDVELVLGQVARPWKPVLGSEAPIVTPDSFTSFDEPGYAKIVFGLRVDPRGATSSVLTAETRVALTDPQSRQRFRRYWMFIGPFSDLIRRIALRMLNAELRRRSAAPENGGRGMADIEGAIVINRPPDLVFDTVADERNEPRYNPRLRNVEKITTGPVGVGTRFRAETVRIGRASQMVIEFIDFDRPRRLGSSTHMSSVDFRGALTFDPDPEGTRMRWSWDVRAHGVLKLLQPLLVRMGRRQEQAIWSALKRYLEQHA
jgi:Polyketide cyclase / dehydrase and lipid transport